jgi:hypothetical protein
LLPPSSERWAVGKLLPDLKSRTEAYLGTFFFLWCLRRL